MPNQADFEDLISSLYETVLEPDLLPDWQQKLTDRFRGSFSTAFYVDHSDLNGYVLSVSKNIELNLDELARHELEHYDFASCPRAQFALTHPNQHVIRFDHLHTKDSEKSRCPTTQHYKSWLDGGYYLNGSNTVADRWTVYLHVERPLRNGHVDQEDISLFERVNSHFGQAMRMAHKLQDARSTAGASYHLLDRLPVGIALVSKAGKLIYCNAELERLFRLNDGLYSDSGKLTARSSATDAELDTFMGAALALTGGGLDAKRLTLSLPRPSGKEPFIMLAAPYVSPQDADNRDAAALIMVSDPGTDEQSMTDILQGIWNLTPTESAMALEIAAGNSVKEAAERMGISRENARTHLKHVFQKLTATASPSWCARC